MISVVIPLYNKRSTIGIALKSVLDQKYIDFEIVVVDDGSTDSGADTVKEITDPRIRLISQPNAGVSAARNRGIKEAKGEFIAFLDADDEWLPDYLVSQKSLAEQYPQCDVFATNYKFRDAYASFESTVIRNLTFTGESGILDNYFEVASCSHPPLCASAVMVRKTVMESIDGFPVGIQSGEDLLTWARLAVRYRIAYATIPSAIYNLGEGYDKKNLPPRRQDEGDPVGKNLKMLYREHPTTRGFKKYISHWHKMRASVAIRYDERKETIREAFVSLKYNILNVKVMPFIVLALLPKQIRHKIISVYR